MDDFSVRYADLLTGSCDCVDRMVLNAYYPLGHDPGGFRTWWRRWHDDGDDSLDDAHLIRLVGRFARRVRGWARASGVPVINCTAGDRMHLIAEEYLREHTVGVGVFLILVAKAPATVWKVARSVKSGAIQNLGKTRQFVNHSSFHIMNPTWVHLTIKMSGRPPFAAQVILNGHEYVARTPHAAEVGFAKEGNGSPGWVTLSAWPRSQTPCPTLGLQGVWARSSTPGSRPPASVSGWIWPTSSAATSATPTRSTRSSTAGN
jgi:hypothetical protein